MDSKTAETRHLEVSGATLYLEVRGTGPVLLCITGGPTDAGMYGDLASRLSDRYTVVAYDQRGHSRSPLHGEPEDLSPAVHADDAAAILAAVSNDDPAFVYGNSGGATIGLDLAARYGDRVRALIAHEPPLLEILPDAVRWRTEAADVHATYLTQGAFPAMARFGAMVEEGGPKYSEEMQRAPQTAESQEMMSRMMGNFDLFLGHEFLPIIGYVPDVEALRNSPSRVMPAAGERSEEQAPRRAAIVLAERLGLAVTYLPGAHGGWGSDPAEFAERVHEALQAG
jgi:pimeloyl-ACP methyl ester carboxylesterase